MNRKPRVFAALIFDFDGVLADTESAHYAALREVLDEVGIDLSRPDYDRLILGLPDRASIRCVYENLGQPLSAALLDTLAARKSRLFAEGTGGLALYPGVADFLRRLHPRFLLAIASGAQRHEIEPLLARAGVLELFGAIISAGDVPHGKPSPEPFLAALDALNLRRAPGQSSLRPADCLVIEDAPAGIEAAKAAKMACVGVTTNRSPAALSGADWTIAYVTRLTLEDRKV